MDAAWTPQVGPQADAITATWCHQILYGGARGGGKSDFILGDYLQDVFRYEKHWQGIVFRRTYKQLEDLIRRSHELFPQTGAEWFEGKSRWVWPNGAMLRFRFLDRDADAENYQGHAYPWIGWEELGNFPSIGPYRKLLACNRWGDAEIPTKRVRASANPGGPGQGWIKEYFIDHAPMGYEARIDEATGKKIMFIPARVSDNKILLKNDPGYIDALKGSGPPELVRAWLDGDWNAVVGGFFPEFGTKHLISPQEFPKHWTRFRAIDWGSSKPFCVLWMTISDGTLPEFPTGAVIVYREWYGASSANVGLKMHSEEVARGIIKREEKDEKINYTVVDPSMFNSNDGPSIAEKMKEATRGEKNPVDSYPANNTRTNARNRDVLSGWQQIRDRLIGYDDKPLLYIVGVACSNLVRTLPALQHDIVNAEDVDTEGEDHAADALRYGIMSRPYTKPLPKKDEKPKLVQNCTYNDLLSLRRKTTRNYARI